MAFFVDTCPYCLAERITMHCVAAWRSTTSDYVGYIAVHCPNCDCPSGVRLHNRGSVSYENIRSHDKEIRDMGFAVMDRLPDPQKTVAPEYCPENVKRIYVQAATARQRQEFDSAGAMYRKVLEVALKEISPNTNDMTLAKRINSLAERGLLTTSIADWANHIRILGNPATHEAEEPSREDIDNIAGIAEMVIRYIYTLPGMVKSKRKDPSQD